MLRVSLLGILGTIFLIAGCAKVQRTVSIDSEPPGAIITLNDQEVGRTPMTRDFIWYGTYDLQLRLEGYETKKTKCKVIAPWWQWPPIDLFAELFPARLKDKHHYSYALQPLQPPPSADEMLGRAEQMRLQLQSSRYTKNPATRPVTEPSTGPATTQPTTFPTTESATTQATTAP
jgi:hypothetical protein